MLTAFGRNCMTVVINTVPILRHAQTILILLPNIAAAPTAHLTYLCTSLAHLCWTVGVFFARFRFAGTCGHADRAEGANDGLSPAGTALIVRVPAAGQIGESGASRPAGRLATARL